jgi:hypothetical protein
LLRRCRNATHLILHRPILRITGAQISAADLRIELRIFLEGLRTERDSRNSANKRNDPTNHADASQMIRAAKRGDIRTVRNLASRDRASIEAQDKDGSTPPFGRHGRGTLR